jgi:hypothetical protein
MVPFLRSELFHILMTFNVCGNADTLNKESYLGLLASSLVYMHNQKKSEWKNDMIKLIIESLMLVYEDCDPK